MEKYKVCSTCHTRLIASSENFHKDRTKRDGLRARCKSCEMKKKKAFYEEHKGEKAEYHKEYYRQHKEEIKKRNREYGLGYRASFNGKVVRFNSHSKRRSKLNTTGQITPEQWKECMEFFNWQCAYSGEKLNDDNRTIDHIKPVKAGGENKIYNVVPMVNKYNFSKSDKNMIEWYQEQSFYSVERLNKIMEWQEYSRNKYMEV
mgnify:CR=1 FL=1